MTKNYIIWEKDETEGLQDYVIIVLQMPCAPHNLSNCDPIFRGALTDLVTTIGKSAKINSTVHVSEAICPLPNTFKDFAAIINLVLLR
jgi:hypothetical protein